MHAGNDDPILKLIGELRVPAVAVADVVHDLPSVVVDDAAGGLLQAQHLALRGHRNVDAKSAHLSHRIRAYSCFRGLGRRQRISV